MTILQVKNLFAEKLSPRYAPSEGEALFSIFAGDILGLNKIDLRRNEAQELEPEQEAQFLGIVELLKSGKPYQQIRNRADFFGMVFYVNEHVLIPRPETEELVELAINQLKSSPQANKTLSVLDVGTGSGVIPITLKKHLPQMEVTGIDISSQALKVAQHNAKAHDVEVNFKIFDFLSQELVEVYDVIISNPPYIAQTEAPEIADSVKSFEPNIALFSPTDNALIFYERIAGQCREHLKPGGMVFLEINQRLGAETLALFKNFSHSELIKDLSGNDRFIFAVK